MFSAKALRKYSTTSQVSTPRPCPEASTVYDFNSSKPRFCPRLTSWTIHTVATLSGPFPVACGDRTQFNQKVNGICFARKSSDFRRLSPVSGTRFFFGACLRGLWASHFRLCLPWFYAEALPRSSSPSLLFRFCTPRLRPRDPSPRRFLGFHALGISTPWACPAARFLAAAAHVDMSISCGPGLWLRSQMRHNSRGCVLRPCHQAAFSTIPRVAGHAPGQMLESWCDPVVLGRYRAPWGGQALCQPSPRALLTRHLDQFCLFSCCIDSKDAPRGARRWAIPTPRTHAPRGLPNQ